MNLKKYQLYWGELHTHTYCGSKFGTLEDAVEIAKTQLDFWAPGEHNNRTDIPHPDYNWPEIVRIAKQYNQPGKFIVFPGFEYAVADGDYNAYFCNDEVPEFRPKSFDELFSFVRKNNGILIPHHTGYKVGCRGTDWNNFQPGLMPVVEIFSMHGSSESEDGYFPMSLPKMGPRATAGTAQAGLIRGLKFGFIASTDGHYGYPGSYKMGLTGVYAEGLSRESIWLAILARRTFAVSGDRIKVRFDINSHLMGEEVVYSGKERVISAEVEALDSLDKIEIIKNNKILYRASPMVGYQPSPGKTGKYKVRIEWGWGGEQIIKWDGKLEIKAGELISFSPCFGPPAPNKVVSFSNNHCCWLSHTQGSSVYNWKLCRNGREGTNSIVFEFVGGNDTVFNIELNNQKFQYSLAQLKEGSQIGLMKGSFNEKIKIYSPVPEKLYSIKLKVIDKLAEQETDFYYLRVFQANGQMAWSSPVWITKKV
ncbi:MAG: DUF3604 domain-containing protein [Elusimicrobiota bacterium]